MVIEILNGLRLRQRVIECQFICCQPQLFAFFPGSLNLLRKVKQFFDNLFILNRASTFSASPCLTGSVSIPPYLNNSPSGALCPVAHHTHRSERSLSVQNACKAAWSAIPVPISFPAYSKHSWPPFSRDTPPLYFLCGETYQRAMPPLPYSLFSKRIPDPWP